MESSPTLWAHIHVLCIKEERKKNGDIVRYGFSKGEWKPGAGVRRFQPANPVTNRETERVRQQVKPGSARPRETISLRSYRDYIYRPEMTRMAPLNFGRGLVAAHWVLGGNLLELLLYSNEIDFLIWEKRNELFFNEFQRGEVRRCGTLNF